jgi:hypothetical protein
LGFTAPRGRPNDRLQARLAKAVAARNAQVGGSPRSSIDQPRSSSSVRASIDKESRPSLDSLRAKDGSEKAESKPATPDPAADSAFPKPSPATTPAPDTPASAKDEVVIVKEAPSMEAMPDFSKPTAAAPSASETTNGVTPQADTKADTTPEVKLESKVEIKTEDNSNVRSELKPETEPESKLEPPTQTEEPEKKDTPKPALTKQEPHMQEPKTEEPIKEELKKEEPKKEKAKEEEPKTQEPREAPKKEEIKTQEPKKPTQTPTTVAAEQTAQSSYTNEELETIKARQQEEIQEYVERIDALQSKLQYLSKNAVEAAKKSKSAAAKGSVEQKLAEKDEKIALLMGEGQKLSTTEGKFRTTIRKLRAQIADHEKQIDELKKDKEKSAAEIEAMRNSVNSTEEQEKQNEEVRKVSTALEKQIDALKKDIAARDEAYRRLEHDAKVKAEQAEFANAEALNKALATEREKQKELESTITNLRAEKEAVSEKARLDSTEWKEKVDRATERSRHLEEELKLELRASESKLEAMRMAAEDASSGVGGESQIKLIRQIETLQSQYASASDNWQGIEASLLAKVSNLEKERDEAQRRESEMRKKARDSVSHFIRLRHHSSTNADSFLGQPL